MLDSTEVDFDLLREQRDWLLTLESSREEVIGLVNLLSTMIDREPLPSSEDAVEWQGLTEVSVGSPYIATGDCVDVIDYETENDLGTRSYLRVEVLAVDTKKLLIAMPGVDPGIRTVRRDRMGKLLLWKAKPTQPGAVVYRD